MTTGALIFAFNNSEIDYLSMAAWSAKRIRRHLNIPVAVVTDSTEHTDVFDKVIQAIPEGSGTRHFTDFGTNVAWHNANRTTAYELTPWDQTLVLERVFCRYPHHRNDPHANEKCGRAERWF